MNSKKREERPSGFPSLPVLGQPAIDRGDEDLPRTILITGASGTIGKILTEAWADRYELILLDLHPLPDAGIDEVDLARWDDEWAAIFDEADVVVHLAAHGDPTAEWPEMVGPNLDALNNVFMASLLAGNERLIFASSHRVMAGYHDSEQPIKPDLVPQPEGASGVSKLVGERLGIAMAQALGGTFVALRIGYVQRAENRAEDLPDDAKRRLWLSNADLVDLFTCAVEAEMEPGTHLVLNAMSANQGGRWPIDKTKSKLGYKPQDNAFKPLTQ